MSIGCSSLRCWVAAAAIGCSSLLTCGADAEDKSPSQPAPDSEERQSPNIPTNSPAPAVRKNRLMQLEEDLSRSLQVFKPKTSLEGVTAPRPRRVPPPSATQNKRAKEQADRKKNWVFMEPEDLTAAPTIEEMLSVPEYTRDGQDKKALSPMERFYQGLERRFSAKAKSKPETKDDSLGTRLETAPREGLSSQAEEDLPSGVKESEQTLRKRLEVDAANPAFAPARGTFSDLFGLGEPGATLDSERAHKAMMKDYQQWLNTPRVPPESSMAKGFNAADLSQPVQGIGGSRIGLGASGVGRSDGFATPSAPADPTMIPRTPPDPTANTLNQWNPLYTPPKEELPKPLRPPPPPDGPPRRKFY